MTWKCTCTIWLTRFGHAHVTEELRDVRCRLSCWLAILGTFFWIQIRTWKISNWRCVTLWKPGSKWVRSRIVLCFISLQVKIEYSLVYRNMHTLYFTTEALINLIACGMLKLQSICLEVYYTVNKSFIACKQVSILFLWKQLSPNCLRL